MCESFSYYVKVCKIFMQYATETMAALISAKNLAHILGRIHIRICEFYNVNIAHLNMTGVNPASEFPLQF